jgi:hypothetical protein
MTYGNRGSRRVRRSPILTINNQVTQPAKNEPKMSFRRHKDASLRDPARQHTSPVVQPPLEKDPAQQVDLDKRRRRHRLHSVPRRRLARQLQQGKRPASPVSALNSSLPHAPPFCGNWVVTSELEFINHTKLNRED